MENNLINLHQTTDAKVWAEEFMKKYKEHGESYIAEDIMIGRFANAIMTMYDKINGPCNGDMLESMSKD